MTTTSVTQEPIDIDAALARLILLRREHGLPRPTGHHTWYGNKTHPTSRISVAVATFADLTAWADVLGIGESRRHSHFYDDGSEIHSASADGWHGWDLDIRASVKPGDSRRCAELDADTVASLEEVAKGAPKQLVSDDTIAEAEQIVRMVAPKDLALPKAECGCPIKGDRVDHCEACTEAVAA